MTIDEPTSETASLYVFNLLEPAEAQAFARRIEADDALRAHVDALTASAALLAHAAPPQPLPTHLEARVLGAALRPAPSNIIPIARGFPTVWIGWAAAACLALVCAWLQADRSRLHQELADSRERDELSRMQIATLSSKLQEAPDASAVVVWDEEKQRGLLKIARMPKAEGNRDYQLWVIDPQYTQPVSAGVVEVEHPAFTSVAFHAAKPIGTAQKFAVSLEQKGGVEEVHGPIVMIGE